MSNLYVKKCLEENHGDLSLIVEAGKSQYFLIEDFNTFMYDHRLHGSRKHFFCYCLQAFSTEEVFKRHIISLKLMVNKW